MAHTFVPGILADFGSPDRLTAAASQLREQGYQQLEFYTPFPVAGASGKLDLERPRLPRVVLIVGILGAGAAFWIQWFANAVDYPLVVGGRPILSIPAWIPVTFEIGILAAALAAFSGLLLATGLPRLWHPAFTVPGFELTSVKGFWLAVAIDDARFDFDVTRNDLERLGPLRIEAPGGWP